MIPTRLDVMKGGGDSPHVFHIYIHNCACGPKTVPVKRTFLNIAIVGWSGVGWGGMLTFLVLRT